MNITDIERVLDVLMKYALFQGEHYGDGVGWNHFSCVGNSIEELEGKVNSDWYQIVDLHKLEIVKEGEWSDICTHGDTYRVESQQSYGEGMIVSGQYQSPGLYCVDCRKKLSD